MYIRWLGGVICIFELFRPLIKPCLNKLKLSFRVESPKKPAVFVVSTNRHIVVAAESPGFASISPFDPSANPFHKGFGFLLCRIFIQ